MKKSILAVSLIILALTGISAVFTPKNVTTVMNIEGTIAEAPKAGITEDLTKSISAKTNKQKKEKLGKVNKKKDKTKANKPKAPAEPTLDEIFAEMGEKYNLEPELLKAVATIESNLNPMAVSSDGMSQGLMQIQPRWWNDAINYLGIYDMYNSRQNVELGAYILNYLIDRYDSEYRALEAYNTGNPDSTNGYADRVLKVKEKLQNVRTTDR